MNRAGALQKYDSLMGFLDRRFRFIRSKYASQMNCGSGCAQCCRGLFDVSLPDALRVARAFGMLPHKIKAAVADRSSKIHRNIVQEGRELQEPFFLDKLSEERIDRLLEGVSDVRCPFLDDGNRCLIYRDRPAACRLEGVPMVDSQDGLFGDWCELNFRNGIPPPLAEDLRVDFHEIQDVEREATACLSHCLLGNRQDAVTVFLPSVIAAFDSFWIDRI